MVYWTWGMILLAGFYLGPKVPQANQPQEPLFDLLADYIPEGMDTPDPVVFLEGPVAVPEPAKNNVSLGAGFCGEMSIFVLLKLDKDATSRELKMNPLFFVPGSQGFLKLKVTLSPRKPAPVAS